MSRETFGSLTDPPAAFTVVGARVIDPAAGTDEIRDLAVVDGFIALEPDPAAERIDGRGLVLAPGLCDLHAHLREPGGEAAETVASATRAAARGGFTTDLRDAEHRTAPRLGGGGRPWVVRGAAPAGSG